MSSSTQSCTAGDCNATSSRPEAVAIAGFLVPTRRRNPNGAGLSTCATTRIDEESRIAMCSAWFADRAASCISGVARLMRRDRGG